MKAIAVYPRVREYQADGSFVEIVVWHLDEPVPPCGHCYKYRMVYVRNGVRVVGYDNEHGKGDHRHIDGVESPYAFTTPEQLLQDFRNVVAQWIKDQP